MASFAFNKWCTTTQLKEATVDALKKEDLHCEEALKLLTVKDVEEFGLSLSVGQKRVLEAALKKLKLGEQAKPEPEDVTDPITTKSLAKDGGLEEILKKIEGAGSLEDSLLAIGSTDLFPGKRQRHNTRPRSVVLSLDWTTTHTCFLGDSKIQ